MAAKGPLPLPLPNLVACSQLDGLIMPTTSLVGGPVPAIARSGRHQQRYDPDGARLVAGCIPVRIAGDRPEDVEVLLISSRGGKGWVFPKGGWETDETVEAAAKRETVEEAGVRGTLEEPLLGTFSFSSGKPNASPNRGRCTAYVYVMHVAEELEVWPERLERERCWVPLAEAGSRCRHPWMREALQAWCSRKGWQAMAAAQQQQAQPPQQQQPQQQLASAGDSATTGGSSSC